MTTKSPTRRPRAQVPGTEGPQVEGPLRTQSSAEAPCEALTDNVKAIAEMESSALLERSTVDRVSDAITRGIGSTLSVVLHAGWFSLWILVNLGVIPLVPPFDPFPFSFLTLTVSLEAIFLTIFVLMSQNRMSRQADHRAHLDLQVDMLAEEELTAILEMVQALCKKLDVDVPLHEKRIDDLLKQTDIRRVAAKLTQNLPKA